MLQFGKTVGTACLTFVITNIDDAFVLVTFFAESSTSRSLTPLKITAGQYLGFTIIVIISLTGYAIAVALPSEPIGFLGLLPLLLGVWRFLGLLFAKRVDTEEDSESKLLAKVKSIFKVAMVTIMNGGDNIGTYIPLFSQAKGAEIAVYVVVYYILLGVWCFVAFLIMKEKHILRVAKKYASYIIPFLYIGLGIYIVVKSNCYPWSIDEINNQFLGNPGQVIMGIISGFVLLFVMGLMVWVKLRKQRETSTSNTQISITENTQANAGRKEGDDPLSATTNTKYGDNMETEEPAKECGRHEINSTDKGTNGKQSQRNDEVHSSVAVGDGEIQMTK